jgi:hypothetical protein
LTAATSIPCRSSALSVWSASSKVDISSSSSSSFFLTPEVSRKLSNEASIPIW